MAKKAKWTEPELPEVEEVKEEIVVEETIVAEPEPEVVPATPAPVLEDAPPKEDWPEGAKAYLGKSAKGRAVYKN